MFGFPFSSRTSGFRTEGLGLRAAQTRAQSASCLLVVGMHLRFGLGASRFTRFGFGWWVIGG